MRYLKFIAIFILIGVAKYGYKEYQFRYADDTQTAIINEKEFIFPSFEGFRNSVTLGERFQKIMHDEMAKKQNKQALLHATYLTSANAVDIKRGRFNMDEPQIMVISYPELSSISQRVFDYHKMETKLELKQQMTHLTNAINQSTENVKFSALSKVSLLSEGDDHIAVLISGNTAANDLEAFSQKPFIIIEVKRRLNDGTFLAFGAIYKAAGE